jgi:hypothetical protein
MNTMFHWMDDPLFDGCTDDGDDADADDDDDEPYFDAASAAACEVQPTSPVQPTSMSSPAKYRTSGCCTGPAHVHDAIVRRGSSGDGITPGV